MIVAISTWFFIAYDRDEEITNKMPVPDTGTTPQKISALSIGMTADEVDSTLQLPYNVGIEVFPFNYKYNDASWVSNELPIKNVGYVQAVFIQKQLVGLGSLDPDVGPLCGGCLMDMMDGKRPLRAGLPNHVQGNCPICGSQKVVPFGATLQPSNPVYLPNRNPQQPLQR